MKVLITGAAGFIGFHLCQQLLEQGIEVVGIDNINDYYDVRLKYARLAELGIKRKEAEAFYNEISSDSFNSFKFIRLNLEDKKELYSLFEKEGFDVVCNLAAQAGVRYSIENPDAYVQSNIVGFLNILEACRNFKVDKLVYASSSSVYGNSDSVPFKETDNVDHPISLYAATKKSNELMAHTYSHLYGIETIGLRFFTVYGPWGRPDMAPFLFTDAILKENPIKVFNNGDLSRDFTYIDDIVEGIKMTLINESKDKSKYQLYNIGNNSPVQLMDFISEIEKNADKKAIKKMYPMQPGDVYKTYADVTFLSQQFNYKPKFDLKYGIKQFVDWFKLYYKDEK
ncbi:NAD-dependent epimerase [Tenacibaculum aiptasiae]|uniref:NAD-dependent epimerase n=1 Tax=Tenacibaculum aiptasiae TaxID=426481 RepID=A0A7J5A6W8_9FLAO|nr:NAD-dependent epimerase [Tenacibaculum aiptasiae]KAB1153275.1 NAD-dependent epimerase [Tenacibaculum aiptasiae]